jgi:hypothetical protein
MSSLVRFENKKYFYLHTFKNALAYYSSGVVFVNSEVVGLAPSFIFGLAIKCISYALMGCQSNRRYTESGFPLPTGIK